MATNSAPFASIKALLFDVFGTVVDWRGSTARILHAQCLSTLKQDDNLSDPVRAVANDMGLPEWQLFTKEWLQEHANFVDGIASARMNGQSTPAFRTIDQFMLDSLPILLEK